MFLDSHPAASLTVTPDREQHFTFESVTLNCGGNSAEWKVRTSGGNYIPLGLPWEEDNGFTTRIRTSLPSNGVYWCESESADFSNAVNITMHGTLSFFL